MALRRRSGWDGVERRDAPMVLVVSDDSDSNELIVRVLNAHGFRAAKAGDEATATQRVSELLPRAVVIDLSASGIGSSLKILERIRSHQDRRVNQTRVVLVARSNSNRVFSIQSGVDAFVTRPFHVNELLAALGETIARPNDDRVEHRKAMLAEIEREPHRR